MYDDLRQRIEEAQAILAATSRGEWAARDREADLAYVVNLAGYTHSAPLVVAAAMLPPAADALVYCHNRLPQLLADVLAALHEKTPTTLPPADYQCPKCGEFLEATFQTCPRCGATV